jgi:hypothetical protein
MKNKFYVFFIDDVNLQHQLDSLTESLQEGEEVATIETRMNKLIVLTKIYPKNQIKNLLLEERKK